MNVATDPPRTQYAVRVTFVGSLNPPEYYPKAGRFEAEENALRIGFPNGTMLAEPVERTPTVWEQYSGTVPALAEGEVIQWGIQRAWADGYAEVEPMAARYEAEEHIAVTGRINAEPDTVLTLALRVLPPWRPVGGG